MKKFNKLTISIFTTLILIIALSVSVFAADGVIFITSVPESGAENSDAADTDDEEDDDSANEDSDEAAFDGVYNVGDKVYEKIEFESENSVSVYYAEIQYDTERLEYVSGGSSVDGDVIIVSGCAKADADPEDEDISVTLEFKAKASGESGINILNAKMWAYEDESTDPSESTELTVSTYYGTGITISGESSSVSFMDQVTAQEYAESVNTPVLGTIKQSDDSILYVLDITNSDIQDVISGSIVTSKFNDNDVKFLVSNDSAIKFIYLMDSNLQTALYAVGKDNDIYTVKTVAGADGTNYFMTSIDAVCSDLPNGITLEDDDHISYVVNSEGNGGYYYIDTDGNLVEYKAGGAISIFLSKLTLIQKIALGLGIIILIVLVIVIIKLIIAICRKSKQVKTRKLARKRRAKNKNDRQTSIPENPNVITTYKGGKKINQVILDPEGEWNNEEETEEEEQLDYSDEVIEPEDTADTEEFQPEEIQQESTDSDDSDFNGDMILTEDMVDDLLANESDDPDEQLEGKHFEKFNPDEFVADEPVGIETVEIEVNADSKKVSKNNKSKELNDDDDDIIISLDDYLDKE